MSEVLSQVGGDLIIAKIQKKFASTDSERIVQAFRLAEELYGDARHHFLDMTLIDQVRGTLDLVMEYCLDADGVIGFILHKSLEQGNINLEELEDQFGSQVREIVSGLHLLAHVSTDDPRHSIDDLRIMLVSVSEDVRVVLLSLCRRCFAIEHLHNVDHKQRLRLCRETLQLFAPVAARLGIYTLKHRLETAAFPHVFAVEYENITDQLKHIHEKHGSFFTTTVNLLSSFLHENKINVSVQGREKYPYSIFLKQRTKGLTDIEKIYDLFALRVLVDTEEECYQVLGLLHKFATPLSYRFKDFISFPKPNGYQSLHTCLMRLPGVPADLCFEVQIRTRKMHREAEYGVSAHWNYKEGVIGEIANRLQLKNVLQRQQLLTLGKEKIDSEKATVNEASFVDHIYVLTPSGDIIELSEDATPLDFAFAIHTDVGLSFRAARVNGSIVPISHKLENGDVVHILTYKQPRPTLNWLDEVRTSSAKHKLRAYFASQDRDKYLVRGRKLINAEFAERSIPSLDADLSQLKIIDGSEQSVHEREGLLIKIGKGAVRLSSVLRHIGIRAPLLLKKKKVIGHLSREEHIVEVEGGMKMPLHFAKCCNPEVVGSKPPIIGFVTRAGQVTVHRKECGMLRNANPERRIGVRWSS